MLLDGKVAIVTGSTRGLGRGFAEALAAEGAKVVVNGTNAALVDEVVAGIGENAAGVAGSVADWATAERLTQTALDRFGRLDVLINNAGIVSDRTLLKMDEANFDAVMEVNVKGVFAATRFAAQAMKDGGGGKIVSVISNSGLRGGFGQTNYAASKAGVAGMTRTWALELERYKIQVNGLWPVAVTDMTQVLIDREQQAAKDEDRTPLTARELGLGNVADVAQFVVYMASDLCTLHGQILTCNGTKIALWSHPEEVVETVRDHWTPEELKTEIDATFAPFLQTVGHTLT
jgi:NAD(P)-dependent dehydrogenase (short-subunit alcohol dehydrogenase family)